MKIKPMKKKLAFYLIILLIGLTLTGCSSIQALIQANISGLPYWVYRPQFGIDSSKTAFVGQGKASTVRQAELFAYSDLLAQLSEYLGVELGQEQYKELSVLGTISEFGLTVSDTATAFQEGESVYYVHAVASSELLEQASSEETKRRNELAKNVQQLILEGDEYVKDGKDLKGVSYYLQSMALSYGQDYLEEEYSYSTILEDVKEILNSITITLLSQDSNSAECTVQVLRKTNILASKVKAAEIKASYQAVDVTGQSYADSFVYTTDDYGMIKYNPLNFTMVRKGSVVFALDFDDEITAIESVADSESVAELKALLQAKAVTFEYDREYSLGSIAVSVIEHDASGYVTGNKETTDYLVYCLNLDGAKADAYYALSDQEDDVYYDYVQTRGSCDCLLVCRFGQIETINSSNGIFITVEGTATLYDTSSSTYQVLYESGIVYATGSADNFQDAITQAYVKLADVVHSLLKDAYV